MNVPAVVWVLEQSRTAYQWEPVEVFLYEENAKDELEYMERIDPESLWRVTHYVREEPRPIEPSPLTDDERRILSECEEPTK